MSDQDMDLQTVTKTHILICAVPNVIIMDMRKLLACLEVVINEMQVILILKAVVINLEAETGKVRTARD